MDFRMWARAKNVPKGSRCAYCGGWGQIVEHLIPSLKPLDVRWNEVYACIPCNGVKMAYESRGPINPIKTRDLIELVPMVEALFFAVPKCWEDPSGNYAFWPETKKKLQVMFSIDWDIESVASLKGRGSLNCISGKELMEWGESEEVKAAEKKFDVRLFPLREKSNAMGYGTHLWQWEDLAGDICLGLYEADIKNRKYFYKLGFQPFFRGGV